VVGAAVDLLWNEIGLDHEAMDNRAVLDACDTLTGPGRWMPEVVDGGLPAPLPHEVEPDRLGWHIEGSDMPAGATVERARTGSARPWNTPSSNALR
jgi:hypothetical protein